MSNPSYSVLINGDLIPLPPPRRYVRVVHTCSNGGPILTTVQHSNGTHWRYLAGYKPAAPSRRRWPARLARQVHHAQRRYIRRPLEDTWYDD